MKYRAFNADDQLIATAPCATLPVPYLTIAAAIEALTASGLAWSATTVQIIKDSGLIAQATRTAPGSAGQYSWMVQDFLGAQQRYEPTNQLPTDGPADL